MKIHITSQTNTIYKPILKVREDIVVSVPVLNIEGDGLSESGK